MDDLKNIKYYKSSLLQRAKGVVYHPKYDRAGNYEYERAGNYVQSKISMR